MPKLCTYYLKSALKYRRDSCNPNTLIMLKPRTELARDCLFLPPPWALPAQIAESTFKFGFDGRLGSAKFCFSSSAASSPKVTPAPTQTLFCSWRTIICLNFSIETWIPSVSSKSEVMSWVPSYLTLFPSFSASFMIVCSSPILLTTTVFSEET